MLDTNDFTCTSGQKFYTVIGCLSAWPLGQAVESSSCHRGCTVSLVLL